MKAKILHESKGRIRFQCNVKRMTLEEADLLEAWLSGQSWADEVVVHERTCCAIVRYNGTRSAVLEAIAHFSFAKAEAELPEPVHSSRALNREFKEKLVGKVATKIGTTLFLPCWLCAARTVWHMIPFVKRGLSCLWHREMKVELLDAISISVSVARRDFGTAGMVIFLLEIGDLLEEWTHKKSVADLARSMSLNVDRVWKRTEEGDVLTPIAQISAGDVVVVRAGGVIPMDGIVVEGESSVNQASLTGESIPVAKRPESAVYAGTVVDEGECILKVKSVSGQSRYDQVVAMIEKSEQLKSASENKAANLADKLVPYTFAGSILAYALTRNTTRALSVLMVDFSCALKLAMPLAVLSAMREASKRHITVKGGKFMEAVAHADTIVFDKTGTLTHACPQVAKVIPFAGHTENEMLRLAACLEEHFPHSMANAVVREAKKRDLKHEEFHSKVEYIVAHGIVSAVEGERVLIGSAHFVFDDEGCSVPEGDQALFDNLPPEYSHLYLAIGKELAAVICISDPLRDEAKDVLKALNMLGVTNTVMLTGDSERTARAIAAQVGVNDFRAGVLPADKAQYIADMRKAGHTVLMVGDGINDSPALSEADAGIAISDGAAIAREIADITISADTLWELVELRQIAMALMKRIDNNYRFVIGFNGSLIALGVMGIITPATSAALHNFSTLGVSLHSMSALTGDQSPSSLADIDV
ncbi:MAG: heavy metal translocating P-type ATPase [Peptococcaceae bacterium]|nr:heavy metal translocating P-type ATPase [Peptococcaceae bacterium]